MHLKTVSVFAACAVWASCSSTPAADGKYYISSEGIRASFIPYGASISNLFINDTHGVERDIVLGFDNATYYGIDKQHPHLGGVPGRYANRIKNGTFSIDGKTYHTDLNDNGGLDTLHGGNNGWDWRNWTVQSHTCDSITFSLLDKDGEQGFPGDVLAIVTYTLTPHKWHISMSATALTKKTPIMLSSHTYWNLDGFQDPATALALNHTLHMPYSGQRIATDGILIPNGTVLPNEKYSVNDFWSAPKQIGANFSVADGNCGTGCRGYDTCYLVNRHSPFDWQDRPIAQLGSSWSGINIDIFSDQEAFQMYSCGGQNGTLTLKQTQGLKDGSRPRTVQQYGCIVMEVQDWIDAINHPGWQRDERQVFGPQDGTYTLNAVYEFSVKR